MNGQDVNLEQVRRGCGWHYKQYQNEQSLDDRLNYNAAEESARARRVGLWVDNEPIPAWAEWVRVAVSDSVILYIPPPSIRVSCIAYRAVASGFFSIAER